MEKEIKVINPLEKVRNEIVKVVEDNDEKMEFILVLRKSTGDKHEISSTIKSESHFGMMHMLSRAANSWEKVNIEEHTEASETTDKQ